MASKRVKGKIEVEQIRYFKDEWGIILASVVECTGGEFIKDEMGYITVKGSMPCPRQGGTYYLTAEEIYDPKWGLQYDSICMASAMHVNENDESGKRKYLETLFTETIVQNLYEALDDPFLALKEKNYPELVKVKGCGAINAVRWSEKFEEDFSLSRLYIELEKYSLTALMLKKLLAAYKSPDIIINKVKSNPYILTEISGIGFKRADEIALKSGITQYDKRRIEAFISYTLKEKGSEGYSYIASQDLMDLLCDQFGMDIPDTAIAESIHEMKNELWWNEDKTLIGLQYYRDLEQSIADEMWRIKIAESKVKCPNWEDKIKEIEIAQGFEFTEQQMIAINTIMNNNLTIINGVAGSGKSSIAFAVLELLKKYTSAVCALSGKAATRLAEISGKDGYTIHRLLGASPGGDGLFKFNKDNPLAEDVIIVDEISMIGGWLFNSLLQAVQSGTKVILLGDTGQLEAIGECNVASDAIGSTAIPLVTLDKIHRQAAKSAIITESLKIRKGTQIIPSKEWAGVETRGEYQDLVLDIYSDKSNTIFKTKQRYIEELKRVGNDIMRVQMIAPMRFRGEASVWNLNLFAQEYYNPHTDAKNEIEVFYPSRGKCYIREGDKVINVKNNYKTLNVEGEQTPIYNGNIGVVKKIDAISKVIVVDFARIGEVIICNDLSTIELGYCITVHKFQGAQTDTVIIAIDYSSYALLSRELLYTAITRAQKKCVLIAQNSALRFATSVENVSKKQTHLLKILFSLMHPEKEKIVF